MAVLIYIKGTPGSFAYDYYTHAPIHAMESNGNITFSLWKSLEKPRAQVHANTYLRAKVQFNVGEPP